MEIKAVAFDLEGPIIDAENCHFKATRLAAMEVGVIFDLNNPAKDIASRIEDAIGGGDALIAQGIFILSDRKVPATQIRRRKIYFYNQIVNELETIEPRPGFLQVLEQIRALELPVAIASLTPRNQAEILLERSGIGKLFPENLILLEDFGGKLKPYPDVYLETARRMDIHPRQQLVFEDSVTGITAARTAGSTAIAVPVYWETAGKLIEAGAYSIFRDWRHINILGLIQTINESLERI